jgi:hypothetical protein
MSDFMDLSPLSDDSFVMSETLESWLTDKSESWRDDYQSRYQEDHREFYRLWRGVWSEEDGTRKSERSRFISPNTAQAVEESCAELDMSMTPVLFDIQDDYADKMSNESQDIQKLRQCLTEDLLAAKIQPAISEAILIAAIYGSGVAEVELTEVIEQKIAVKPAMDGAVQQVGVQMQKRPQVRLRPLLPQNVLCDPNSTNVDNGLGIFIDEFVGSESIRIAQEEGIYDDTVDVGTTTADDYDLSPDQETVTYGADRVRRLKYFGLVPRHLLEELTDDLDMEVLDIAGLAPEEEQQDSYFVEAIVVMGNGHILSAVKNPYMLQDRPIVSFQWDNVPNRFWGRGVVEKARTSQNALDTEIRSRIDALALTVHPMMAIDATRMPRGADPTVRPGKTIKVNGNPAEILQPFNFGAVDQITFSQAGELQKMLQQATGAINSAGMPAQASASSGTGAIAMSLGASMKRHKRTLTNFQTCFLIPLIQKAAWRYMQFDAEHYPVGDYKFNATGSMGLIAREYETSQLSFLLQTMGADSPLYPVVLQSIVDNMNLSNREELKAQLIESSKPDPAEAERVEQKHEMEVRVQATTLKALDGQAAESMAKAAKVQAEMNNIEVENQIAYAKIAAMTIIPEETDTVGREFEQKMKVLDEIRKDRELSLRETKMEADIAATQAQTASDADSKEAMMQFMAQPEAPAPAPQEAPQEAPQAMPPEGGAV